MNVPKPQKNNFWECNFHIWFQPPGHDNILRTPVIQTLSGIHQHNNIAFQRQSRLREQGQAGGRVFRHCLFLAIVVAPQTGSALGSLERDEAVLNAWRHSLQSKAISWVSGIHLVAAANWENWRSDLGSFLGQLTILWQQHHLFGHLVYITDLCSANHNVYIYICMGTTPTRAYLELFFMVFICITKAMVLLSNFLCALYTTISLGAWFLRINPD